MGDELKPCPYCGSLNLEFQFRQALNKKTRYGRYDASIYCKNCYAYGPRIKSESLHLTHVDLRHETPTDLFKNIMKESAIEAWNRRISNEQFFLGESESR